MLVVCCQYYYSMFTCCLQAFMFVVVLFAFGVHVFKYGFTYVYMSFTFVYVCLRFYLLYVESSVHLQANTRCFHIYLLLYIYYFKYIFTRIYIIILYYIYTCVCIPFSSTLFPFPNAQAMLFRNRVSVCHRPKHSCSSTKRMRFAAPGPPPSLARRTYWICTTHSSRCCSSTATRTEPSNVSPNYPSPVCD